ISSASCRRRLHAGSVCSPDEYSKSLPDVDTFLRFEVKLFLRFHRVSLVPCVDVADGLGAFAVGGVLVGDDLRTQGGVADLLPPALSKGEEEALVTGKAVNNGKFFPAERE